MMKYICLFVFIFSSYLSAYVGVFDSYNIRQMAMGGTHVVAIKDSTAFYQNPAVLELEKKFKIAIPRVGLGINPTYLNKLSGIQDNMDSEDESEQIKYLKTLIPLDIGASVSLSPLLTFSKKSFGISMFSEGQVSGFLRRKSSPTLRVEGHADTSVVMGLSRTFHTSSTPFYVGIAPKFVHRVTIYDKSTGSETLTLSQSDIIKHVNGITEQSIDYYESSGMSVDLGVLYPFKYTFSEGFYGLTVRNFVSSLSGKKEINGVSKDVGQFLPFVCTVGVGMNYDFPYLGKLYFAGDYNLVAPTKSFFKRIHLGVEKKIWKILDLRGGINQGYIVGGVGLNLYLVKIDYAFFAQELSETIGASSVNTQHIRLGILF
ncbi:hypothetical protein DID78_00360 [Candidatus Marinamargulisbacteria bacterium SCGC AG-343-D04]|nr:hypothetical protein DID78_00360 [Candidatus Marinamargulisbacteria bacterium SCGC AG-343-D04]